MPMWSHQYSICKESTSRTWKNYGFASITSGMGRAEWPEQDMSMGKGGQRQDFKGCSTADALVWWSETRLCSDKPELGRTGPCDYKLSPILYMLDPILFLYTYTYAAQSAIGVVLFPPPILDPRLLNAPSAHARSTSTKPLDTAVPYPAQAVRRCIITLRHFAPIPQPQPLTIVYDQQPLIQLFHPCFEGGFYAAGGSKTTTRC